ncbi:MAG TPA: hypothetical protein VGU20_13945 [Stellaceae bacterium]|nr:hypothetical protein [Stellaceae bacterium]
MFRPLWLIPVLLTGLAIPAIAADLPKSGSFDIQTGWKSIGETTQVADKHTLGTWKSWGVSFNAAGNGPLHMGPAVCTTESEAIEGTGTAGGKCAWSDADGDKIFSDWSGKFTPTSALAGSSTITSGTGKYNGIHGNGPFTCKVLNAATSQSVCTQHFDYQLTLEATGTSTPSK